MTTTFNKMFYIKTILKEGKWFFFIPLLIIIYLTLNSIYFNSFSSLDLFLLLVCLFIIAYTIFFLRPPVNFPKENSNNIYSSADGYVISMQENADCPYDSSQKYNRVTVFMHVASMHWNQSPVKGRIFFEEFNKGQFKSAFFKDERSWQSNEHQVLGITNDDSKMTVFVVMVAGLVARRIRFFAKKETSLEQGNPFGLIRYGSANVLYFPTDFEINVKYKQKVRAGKTVLAVKKEY